MIFDAFSIEFGTPVGTANTFSQSVPVKTNTHTKHSKVDENHNLAGFPL